MGKEVCRFKDVSEEGYVICNKIKRGNREVTESICREICPLPERVCIYLKFSMTKEELFSAIGLGGRKTEMRIETAGCSFHKKPIKDLKECQECLDLKEELRDEELLKEGYRILSENLGEDKTKEFLRLFLERKII